MRFYWRRKFREPYFLHNCCYNTSTVFNILSEHFFFFFFFFQQKRYFGSGLMKNYIKTILGGSKGIFQKICKLLGIKTSCQESPPTPQNVFLTLSWRRSLSYRHQVIDLLCKSIDWFLYHKDFRHEEVH